MTMDDFYIRLMNEEIDGIISVEDAEKLDVFIRSDPEARRYYEELKVTMSAIDGTSEIDPPPELRARIFDSVYGRSREEPAARSGGRRTLWRSLAPAFVAGVAAGLILFAVIHPLTERTAGQADHGATIGAADSEGAAVERFDAFGVEGSILPLFENGSMALTIAIASDTDVSVLAEFEDGISFESIGSNEGAAFQMEVDEKSLLLVHHGGAEYVIKFRTADKAAVVVRIFTDGKTVSAMKFVAGE